MYSKEHPESSTPLLRCHSWGAVGIGLGAPQGGCWLHGDVFFPTSGSLMRVLVTLMAPVYWSFAHTGGDVPGGILLARGTFRHESQVEFGTGEGCSACGSPAVTSLCEKGQGQCLLLPGFTIPVPHPLSPWPLGAQPGALLGSVPPGGQWSWFWGAVCHPSALPSPQVTSCASPTLPGVRMPAAPCCWTACSAAPCPRASARPRCCCRCWSFPPSLPERGSWAGCRGGL